MMEPVLRQSGSVARKFVRRHAMNTVQRSLTGRLARLNTSAKSAQPRDFMDIRFMEELDCSGFINRLYK
jgi:hypothetical protein